MSDSLDRRLRGLAGRIVPPVNSDGGCTPTGGATQLLSRPSGQEGGHLMFLLLSPDVPVSRCWSEIPIGAQLATEVDTLRPRWRRSPKLDPQEVLAACKVVRQVADVDELPINGMLAYGQALGTLLAAEGAFRMLRSDAGSPELEELADEIEAALERAGLGVDRG